MQPMRVRKSHNTHLPRPPAEGGRACGGRRRSVALAPGGHRSVGVWCHLWTRLHIPQPDTTERRCTSFRDRRLGPLRPGLRAPPVLGPPPSVL